MKLLFIHAEDASRAEYDVHRLLAEHADPDRVDCFFMWQDHTYDRSKNHPPRLRYSERTLFWDFGRNMALAPKPSKLQRGLLMARRLPISLVALIAVARRIKPDALYTSQARYDVALARFLSALLRIPHIIHIHYNVGPWLGRDVLHALRNTPHLLAVSEFIRQGAIQAGVAPEHIHTLLNPADLSRFMVPRDRRTVRDEFGWPLDTPLIVAAGRLDPSKGHMLLIEAFAQVHATLPHARLLICGEHSMGFQYDRVLKQRVAELNLEHAAVFAGNRRDLPVIFAGADMFCLPTEKDPCPLVFLEAMTAGVPAVACRSGGVPELVMHGETGLLSEPGDTDALAHHLRCLLQHPDEARRIGGVGGRWAQTYFAPQVVAARWAELLEKMRLGGHAPA